MEKQLPKNWIETDLFTIANVSTGKKDANHAKEDGEYVFYTCALEQTKSPTYSFEGPSIIVPGNGNIGYVFYYEGKFEAYQRTYVINDIKINQKYLYYHFKSFWKSRTVDNLFGSTIQYVKIGNFKSYQVAFPPLAEQNRIVVKLDTLFAQLETIKASMAKIPVLLKEFRQQVLTQAVTGKLTEEWRKGKELEDSSTILNGIEKRRRKVASPTLLKKLDEIYNDKSLSIKYNLPSNWSEINLDKVCEKFSYGTSTKSDDDGEFVVLRMGNLQNGKIDWSDLKYTSDIDEYEKYKLKKGDVLFNRTNSPELVGKTSIYEGEKDSIYAGYLIKIWNYEELDSYFLNFVMNSDFVKKWCWEVKSDGVSQSNINAQKLSKLTIPFPSLIEQQEIVSRVESLFAKADAIEQQYQALKEKIDTLPQALLHKALKGELTKQLESDGDARELLKQIQELKKSTIKSKRK